MLAVLLGKANMNARLQVALDEVTVLMDANSGLSIDTDFMPPCPGRTNDVFFGHYDGQPVAIKRYATADRKRQEEKTLKLFSDTGYVPAVLPIESDTILVIDRLPGKPFFMCENALTAGAWADLFRQLGSATASVVACAPGDDDLASRRDEMTSGAGRDSRVPELRLHGRFPLQQHDRGRHNLSRFHRSGDDAPG